MKLARIGIAYYRSFGEVPALIDLRKRATIVIGANNSGKSNVLDALQRIKQAHGHLEKLSDTDRHLRDVRNAPRVVVDLLLESSDNFPSRSTGQLLRFVREFDGSSSRWLETPFEVMNFSDFNGYFQRVTGRRFTRQPSAEELAPIQAEVSERLYDPAVKSLPKVIFIPEHRQIVAASNYEIHGAGIVELLAEWQHPDIGSDRDSEKFLKVRELLRNLLHLPTVELEVSHDKKTIVVKRDGLRLPLRSYGTGIHQLIVLAVAVLSHDSSILCIEEPEVNLHPTLQREFLRFLLRSTNNQYVISTHSNALIEPNGEVDVLHVALKGQVTVPRLVQTTTDSLALLRDLGVQASDLLQANAVIWVEGPSDRIYLNRWLSLVAPDLSEGIHYSIMFYGGRLLAHLSLDREQTAAHDLIQLVRINQYSAIVIDSDRVAPRHRLNETKRRIREEADANGIYCWITDGREIENYLDSAAVGAAYGQLVGGQVAFTFGDFDSLEERLKSSLRNAWRPKYSYNDAKPLRAREIAIHLELRHITPKLRRHLNALVEVIRTASELYHGKTS